MDITTFLYALCEKYAFWAGENDLKLKYEIDKNIPTYVKCSPLYVQNILENLTVNAISFSEYSEIIIRVEWIGDKDLKVLDDIPETLQRTSANLVQIREESITKMTIVSDIDEEDSFMTTELIEDSIIESQNSPQRISNYLMSTHLNQKICTMILCIYIYIFS